MKEILIIKFKLPLLNLLSTVDTIVRVGYQKTGNKFSVQFNGSKGYMSNIVISCEGFQTSPSNIIWIEKLQNKNGRLKNVMINIYHNEYYGIRIAIGENSKPLSISSVVDKISDHAAAQENKDDDLPF